jgi:hypothetical protein
MNAKAAKKAVRGGIGYPKEIYAKKQVSNSVQLSRREMTIKMMPMGGGLYHYVFKGEPIL